MAKTVKTSINDQISNLITQINDKNPYLIVGISLGILLVAFCFVFLFGWTKNISTIGGQVVDLQQKLESAKSDIQRRPLYQKTLKQLNASCDTLGSNVKSKEEIPSVLERLSRIAVENKVSIEQMMPDINHGELVLKNKEGKFIAIPIIIGAKGAYHAFGKFINVLERQNLFSGVSDFAIMSNDADNNEHKIKLVLKIITYEKLDKSEKSDKSKGKGKDAD